MADSANIRSIEQGIDNPTITEEISFYRHWHAQSETYAGGDSLVTALHLGWIIGNTVLLEEHKYGEKRCARVYYFELIREGASLVMPVIANPFVECLIATSALQVI
jgi:hypothetical protein